MTGPRAAIGVTTERQDRRVTAVLSGLAMVLAALATAKGPGLSPDSVSYLSTGINLADSAGLRRLGDQPLTVFPPGVAVIAGLGEAIGVGAETTLRLLSIASYGAIVVLGGVLLQRTVRHPALAAGATMLLAVSPILLGVSVMAWSEPPFAVVVLLFVLAVGRVWERRVLTPRDVAVLSALCWIAFLLRYAGVTLIAAGGLILLLALRPLDRHRLARIAGFGALSASVPVLWMLRNHATDGTYLGPRRASPDALPDVAAAMATTFGRWLLPGADLATRPVAIVGAVGAVLVALGLGLVRTSRLDGEVTEAAGRATMASCALFAAVYIAFLTASSLSTAFARPDVRLLSPVYVPIVALGAVGLGAVLRRLRTTPTRAALAGLLVLFLIAQLAVSIGDVREGARDGIGFGADRFARSEVADAAVQLVESSPSAVLYSTSPNALWAATRLQPLHFAPRDAGVRGLPVAGELEAFADDVACTPLDSYLVVHLLADERVIGLDELRTVVDLDRVAVAGDGAIFRVTAEPAGACHELDLRPTRPR